MIYSREKRLRGPRNELHDAACSGSMERTIALLSRGSINIDQGDPKGLTPLIYTAWRGHSRVARILLNRGANASIPADDGTTALHLSAACGHLNMTADLVKAGADVDAKDSDGSTPLHAAAHVGHSEVVAALIEAGADVDSRGKARATPMHKAASGGRLDAVKQLLRANANPLLTMSISERFSLVPLDVAASHGHSKVVRELIQKVGIEGCAGARGGIDTLGAAAMEQHVDIMAMLMDAGVVDSGLALFNATGRGWVAAVKLLLQQRQRRGGTSHGGLGYVNCCDDVGVTPLFRSIAGDEGLLHLISPKGGAFDRRRRSRHVVGGSSHHPDG